MQQVIAVASTCFACFVFNNLTERCIRISMTFLGQDQLLPITGECLLSEGVRAGRSLAACGQRTLLGATEREGPTGLQSQRNVMQAINPAY
jgi:hypothetical protein